MKSDQRASLKERLHNLVLGDDANSNRPMKAERLSRNISIPIELNFTF